ncbi:phosphatidylinositol-glycan biosynthesis class F protein [Tribolium castaneum]|uniref:Phosphatidylinositol-glycan biosynthesis class F protein-like Protein n=1 Tax=Tribolium castaneum TaxID=7070 RepID=D6WQY4_TRICA|nr:PREDICTED: phosphatidylinositol-glycan biosynthesis class F protein [Tribolium castaneum]EFA06524.1 Phosphatidylinositol-glycan biosynthesis class F protein-like Protein [Tribolium castaneum]|eukprot:XP_968904.1 PREDICTED: phosphatidylinositol-glycan biosynthesis class F protein [Tribolium castaneum]
MPVKYLTPDYSQTLRWNDILTSMYLLLYLSFLYYNNLILSIGHSDSLYNILGLAALEFIKYSFHVSRTKTSFYKHHAKDFIKNVLVLLLLFATIYVVAVLFGAPILSDFEETCMFSLIVTTFTALPLCLYFGGDNTVHMFLSLASYDGSDVQKLFMLKLRLTLFGAWLGAIVIPLDWNRPWQDWPIPCSVGAMVGYMVANFVTSLLQHQYFAKFIRKTGKYML